MLQDIKEHKILGVVRGMVAVDMDKICDILVNVDISGQSMM